LAVFAPSGLTDTYYGLDITREIFGDLYGAPKERLLGNAVAAATNFVCLQGNAQTCQNYALLGDPSVRMNLPTVAPPTNVTATGANLTVNLNWTASTTPGATYNIYPAEGSPPAGYTPTPINGNTPISGTSYADGGVLNTRTYYYYVVAL